jgi:peptidoglycan/xylan/chitin deacetylase (PgdA/CDA1 family)
MATLLVGYDVEAFAVGEGLARMGDHGLREALDPSSTVKALQIIRKNHEETGAPATLFICGRTLLHALDAFRPLAGHPLFDLQQHTYSHTLFKEDRWQGGVFIPSPPEAIEHELVMTSAALKRHLSVDCVGLRAPHGYYRGLTDRPEMLALLRRCGIGYVSSWARNAEGGNPTPLSVQPFWYDEQGRPDLLEIPFQGWLDAFWFEANGIERGEAFGEVLKETIDEIVAKDLTYAACFHDWAMLRYREARTGWVRTLLDYAREKGVEILSYTDFYRRMPAARA